MVGYTGERGIVPGWVLSVPLPSQDPGRALPPRASVTFLGTLRAAVWEGRSGSPDACGGRALEPTEGRVGRGPRGTVREIGVRSLPQCPIPRPSGEPGWRKSQQALCFFCS